MIKSLQILCSVGTILWTVVLVFDLFALLEFYDGNIIVPIGILTSALLAFFWHRAVRHIRPIHNDNFPWILGFFGTFLCASFQWLAIPSEGRAFTYMFVKPIFHVSTEEAFSVTDNILGTIMWIPAVAGILCFIAITLKMKASNHGLESTSAPPAAGTLETHP